MKKKKNQKKNLGALKKNKFWNESKSERSIEKSRKRKLKR